ADLCSSLGEFDGVHGILAYNRTEQKKGHATVYLPINKWIISVGEHTGIIPSALWIRIQNSLERNRSNSYRKPRRNQALLTGLIWCSCGTRMYPKLSSRLTGNGEPLFSYVCKMKERSRHVLCDQPNPCGNQLDASVIAQICLLDFDSSLFLEQLK